MPLDMQGHNGPNKEMLFEYVERETKIDEAIGEAQYTVRALKKEKNNLRALIKAAGFDLGMFDRTRELMALSHEQRQAEFRELVRNMAWMGMPLGTQAEMFSQEETAVPPEIQVSRVKQAGHAAGKLGRERTANPWKPGSLLFATWDDAWNVGREEAAQSTLDAPKRGRGRPPKAEAAKPASGLRKRKGKTTAPPAEPVFAQQQEPEAEPGPETVPAPNALDFDTETEGSA